MATDPAVQAAHRAWRELANAMETYWDSPSIGETIDAVVAAVTPLIRAQAFTEAADAIDERVVGSPPGAKRRRTGRSFYSGLVAAREIVRPLAEGQPPGQYQIPEPGA